MAARVHLVRHGEVHNPDHLVYADLAGYALSESGLDQAREMARHLSRSPVVGIWSSPSERALRTAESVAALNGLPVKVEPDLAEWALMSRWAGVSWDDLDERFPGELASFLGDPTDIPFAPESLQSLAGRISAAVRRIEAGHPRGEVVVVSHSGPLRAGTLALTGAPLTSFWEHDPPHGSVTTLRPGPSWTVETVWAPA